MQLLYIPHHGYIYIYMYASSNLAALVTPLTRVSSSEVDFRKDYVPPEHLNNNIIIVVAIIVIYPIHCCICCITFCSLLQRFTLCVLVPMSGASAGEEYGGVAVLCELGRAALYLVCASSHVRSQRW